LGLSLLPIDVRIDIPVDPNADQARQWLIDELAKPEYRAAQPTWFDRVSSAFWDWLQSLKIGSGSALQGPILIFTVLVIVAAVVAAFVIFGPARRGRRSAISGSLFGQDDSRDAAALRRSAEEAASRGEWTIAMEEIFRSVARGLAERTILSVSPGTTAQHFAARAGAVLPEYAGRLAEAASEFDDVRYRDREGTETAYRTMAELERDLRAAKPALTSITAPA
jgi:hypothetical protein